MTYPRVIQKAAYGAYAVFGLGLRRLGRRGRSHIRRLASGVPGQTEVEGRPHGSKYERPLAVEAVEELFVAHGLRRSHLKFWTNLDYPGDGVLKRTITRLLVNEKVGTHFDLQLASRKDS